jgi:hypothetical protein
MNLIKFVKSRVFTLTDKYRKFAFHSPYMLAPAGLGQSFATEASKVSVGVLVTCGGILILVLGTIAYYVKNPPSSLGLTLPVQSRVPMGSSSLPTVIPTNPPGIQPRPNAAFVKVEEDVFGLCSVWVERTYYFVWTSTDSSKIYWILPFQLAGYREYMLRCRFLEHIEGQPEHIRWLRDLLHRVTPTDPTLDHFTERAVTYLSLNATATINSRRYRFVTFLAENYPASREEKHASFDRVMARGRSLGHFDSFGGITPEYYEEIKHNLEGHRYAAVDPEDKNVIFPHLSVMLPDESCSNGKYNDDEPGDPNDKLPVPPRSLCEHTPSLQEVSDSALVIRFTEEGLIYCDPEIDPIRDFIKCLIEFIASLSLDSCSVFIFQLDRCYVSFSLSIFFNLLPHLVQLYRFERLLGFRLFLNFCFNIY